MTSWMIHLRVAQGIYETLNLVHKTEFVMGNIAPDSGVPMEECPPEIWFTDRKEPWEWKANENLRK